MHQLYHTTCPDNQGFNKAAGFGVLAASCPSEREIPSQIKDLAPYPFALIRAGATLPVRWVWLKTANGTSILVHCAYVAAQQSGQVGTHFSHIIFDIPAEKGLQEILSACTFPFWKKTYVGTPSLSTVYNLPPGNPPADTELTAWLQNSECRRLVEVTLAVSLELGTPAGWKQILLPAQDNLVLNLMHFLARVLPARLTGELTFASMEQRADIGTKIVGLPLEHLKRAVRSKSPDGVVSKSVANLLDAEVVWDELPAGSRNYASWCVNRAALNDWEAIQYVNQLADQCHVESAIQFCRIWRFCVAPHELNRDDVTLLRNQSELAQLVNENTQFLARAMQVALEEPIDAPYLRLLHQHEKKVRKSPKTLVESCLIDAAVHAVLSDQTAHLQTLLEVLLSYHQTENDNRSAVIVSSGFDDHVQEILNRVNEILLGDAAGPSPALATRLALLAHGRKWLSNASRQTSMNHWLTSKNSSEFLQIMAFLAQDRYFGAPSTLVIGVLTGFFNSVDHELTGESELLDWMWNCPVGLLAQATTQVRASQSERLSAIWRGAAFRKDDFLNAPTPQASPPEFECLYDVIRLELAATISVNSCSQ